MPLICFQNFARVDECEEANRHCERLNQKLTDQEQKAVVLNDRYTPNEPVQNFFRMKEYSKCKVITQILQEENE